MFDIDGIVTANDEFIPVYQDGYECAVFINRNTIDFVIKTVIFSNGHKITLNKTFRRINPDGNIMLIDIEDNGDKNIFAFKRIGNKINVSLENSIGEVLSDNESLKIAVCKRIKQFKVTVEILNGIFEEKIFYNQTVPRQQSNTFIESISHQNDQ